MGQLFLLLSEYDDDLVDLVLFGSTEIESIAPVKQDAVDSIVVTALPIGINVAPAHAPVAAVKYSRMELCLHCVMHLTYAGIECLHRRLKAAAVFCAFVAADVADNESSTDAPTDARLLVLAFVITTALVEHAFVHVFSLEMLQPSHRCPSRRCFCACFRCCCGGGMCCCCDCC